LRSFHALPSSVLALALFVLVGPVFGATIYGNVRLSKQTSGTPLGVQLKCGKLISAGQTDGRGNYSLSIAEQGRCTLTVEDKSAEVVLGKDPAQYNFDVPVDGKSLNQR
jgi:hypothetical protein